MDQLFSNKSKISPFSLKIPNNIVFVDRGCLKSVQTMLLFDIFDPSLCSD